MLRSLWTGASGMIAQQVSLDNIANNLANVNTSGFKKQSTEFSTLLYQKLQRKQTDNNGDPKPTIAQVGLGVRVSGLTSRFVQGQLLETGNDYDFAIEGDGFFRIRMADGTMAYTRNGSFKLSIGSDGGVSLATAEGYNVLGRDGEPITFNPEELDLNQLLTDEYGSFYYPGENGSMQSLGIQIGLAQFNNPEGLYKISGTYFRETANSGEARLEGEDDAILVSMVHSQYLEGSNVQTADEIVNMIVTQRAYEMNSKVITASDEMHQQANNLRS